MAGTVKKNFDKSDETMTQIEKVKYDIVEAGSLKLNRATAEPGWKWSLHIGPHAKTERCQMDHIIYMLSGKLVIQDEDGQETSFTAGDVGHIPPGHDAWVGGSDNAVWIDIPH